jgi:hypothetical protein
MSLRGKLSAWDVVYSINTGFACVIAYSSTIAILHTHAARDNELLGGMWAAIAAAFVFRDTKASSVSAGIGTKADAARTKVRIGVVRASTCSLRVSPS